ncbi:MAG: S-methyl-5-thioribose-1-phosphate isomerase [Acidobacteria bacterium]|nr:MAG: S-methyl-5-thioribose-1-phosphate isomerase [Acidobacteriota bacterium]
MSEWAEIRPVEFEDGVLRLLDQRGLPGEIVWVECRSATETIRAIKDMVVRGAPAIGIAGAYGLAADAANARAASASTMMKRVETSAAKLRDARPTAVNLAWAVDRALAAARGAADAGGEGRDGADDIRDELAYEAEAIAEEEENACIAIGAHGADLLAGAENVLTHCNAGALATGAYGTALGVIRGAFDAGESLHVWVDETRPLLQGARLTAWELRQLGIPATIIVDSAAGSFMASGQVDAVVVGADRIAANGDTANKIGTYSLAVLAKHHKIPFYVAAPSSTVDLSIPDGAAVPIEERNPDEVAVIGDRRFAHEKAEVSNPAFDVTPARLITAIVTENGIARAPYARSLSKT